MAMASVESNHCHNCRIFRQISGYLGSVFGFHGFVNRVPRVRQENFQQANVQSELLAVYFSLKLFETDVNYE